MKLWGKNACSIFIGNSQRPIKYNINIYLEELEYKYVGWIKLGRDRIQ
jgi:hypothetical protein